MKQHISYPKVVLSMACLLALSACGSSSSDSDQHTDQTTTQNTPPSYNQHTLLPSNPKSSDTLTHQFSGLTDADNDTIFTTYYWSINNQPITNNDRTLNSTLTKEGDVVTVRAKLVAGSHTVSTETLTTTIEKAEEPEATQYSLILSPENPRVDDAIKVTVQASNTTSTIVSVEYHWLLNDKLITQTESNHLPQILANSIKQNDQLTVIGHIFDGTKIVTTPPISATLDAAKAPLNPEAITIDVSNLPTTTKHGELLSFKVTASDAEQNPVVLELAYGPSGMTMDDQGYVSWTPNEVMFLKQESFNFGFKAVGYKDVLNHQTVSVVDENREIPVVRSSIQNPRDSYSMWVDDYDGDGKNEILSTDSESLIFTLEFNGKDYVQDWVYPFASSNAETINQLLSKDINNDGKADIIIVSPNSISVIDDLSQPAKQLFTLTDNRKIRSASIEDLDNDGSLEIALLINAYSYSENDKLNVYQLNTWQLKHSMTLSEESASRILIGNVDHDPQREIVTNTGHVYDGKTGLEEWFFSEQFDNAAFRSNKFAVGDIDNDGIDEIIGYKNSGGSGSIRKPVVYSATSKSALWEIDTTRTTCSINIRNIDDDPQEEILIHQCSNVVAYDAKTGAPIEQAKWQSSQQNSITTGDINNDGSIELIWGEASELAVASTKPTQEIAIFDTSQLSNIKANGWATVEAGKERAIFLDDAKYLIQMTEAGILHISKPNSTQDGSKANYLGLTVVEDYDNDGFPELISAQYNTDVDAIQVRQLNDNSLEWDNAVIKDPNIDYEYAIGKGIMAVKTSDLNADGFADVLVASTTRVNIYDIINKVTLWKSAEQPRLVRDTTILTNSHSAYIIIATKDEIIHDSRGELSSWQYNGTLHTEQRTLVEKGCIRIAAIERHDQQPAQIICLQDETHHAYGGSKVNIIVFDETLVEINHFKSIEGYGNDFILERNKAKPAKNILLARTFTKSYNNRRIDMTQLTLVSIATGDVIWQSPPLLGELSTHNLHYIPQTTGKNKRLTFATKDAMYITK